MVADERALASGVAAMEMVHVGNGPDSDEEVAQVQTWLSALISACLHGMAGQEWHSPTTDLKCPSHTLAQIDYIESMNSARKRGFTESQCFKCILSVFCKQQRSKLQLLLSWRLFTNKSGRVSIIIMRSRKRRVEQEFWPSNAPSEKDSRRLGMHTLAVSNCSIPWNPEYVCGGMVCNLFCLF